MSYPQNSVYVMTEEERAQAHREAQQRYYQRKKSE